MCFGGLLAEQVINVNSLLRYNSACRFPSKGGNDWRLFLVAILKHFEKQVPQRGSAAKKC